MKRQITTAILTLCALLALAATLFAQGAATKPAAAGNRPKAVAVEPIADVGSVAKGDSINHDFVIRNEGTAPLEITQVQPACGCTVVSFDKTIAPGKTGVVHTVVDTSTFNGPVAKGVTAYTNDPDTPQIQLTIKTKVEPYISVKPGYARYIVVQGEPLDGNIAQILWSSDGTPFDVLSVDTPMPNALKVGFREATDKERLPDIKGKQWRVEMLLSNNAPVGPLANYVTVHTNHPKQKLVQIPVSGFVRPVMAVTPPVADLGQIELKEPLVKRLLVRNFATESINVTKIDNDIRGIDAQLEPVTAGREYQVRLTLKPDLGKGPFNGKIRVHTDSPKTPVIEVEIKGVVL
ncbi:MAG TPA: DUF1573 domain-containing protein [Thermoanaerobaculia bacterium]|nr:DUF1573 domain-containing protein [Thermoanaerobaculia bacterium]